MIGNLTHFKTGDVSAIEAAKNDYHNKLIDRPKASKGE